MSDSTKTRSEPCSEYTPSYQVGADKIGICTICGWAKTEHPRTIDWGIDEAKVFLPDMPLDEWWRSVVDRDIARTAPKIEEYGTRDLEAMGQMYALVRQGRPNDPVIASIWSIMFYALGKIARALASLERGEMPSEDTLFDLSVYSMMARSYQARGKL